MTNTDRVFEAFGMGLFGNYLVSIGGVPGFVSVVAIVKLLQLGIEPSGLRVEACVREFKSDPRFEVRGHLGEWYVTVRTGGGRTGASVDHTSG